jgi:3-phosphoshikimate 1-carboxyvinyltransferase
MRRLGLEVEESEEGFTISGNIKNKSASFESFHDHRIAMAFAILSGLLDNGGVIKNFECVKLVKNVIEMLGHIK